MAVEYRDIPGFPGYRAGDDGSILSCRLNSGRCGDTWRVLRPYVNRHGYQMAGVVAAGGKRRTVKVAVLVLSAFAGACPHGMESCHDNGVRTDDRACNLRWDTHANNIADKVRQGTQAKGEGNARAKLSADDVRAIRALCASGAHGCKAEAARRFGISQAHAGRLAAGIGWGHVASSVAQSAGVQP